MVRTRFRLGLAFLILNAGSIAAQQAQTTAGGPPPIDQAARDTDHKRLLGLLGLDSLPPGARSAAAETYDESKANPFPMLPDPLVFKDGRKVTSAAAWRRRRAEILEDFEREIYGRTPKNTPKVTWEVTSTTNAMNGEVPIVTKQLVGHVDNSAYPQIAVDIQLTLSTPANARGPVPVIMQFGGFGPGRRSGTPPAAPAPGAPSTAGSTAAPATPTGTAPAVPAGPPAPSGASWQAQVLARGWGYATIVPTSIQGDNGGALTQGIIGLVNKGQPRKLDDWGALSAWSWGASRALDYFETDKSVDARQVGLQGHSRYGKATLVAMALDERFAIAYVSSSGEGGAKLHRRKFGETVENVAGVTEYHWMAGNFLKYAGRWDDMPVDSHQLIALCAPRPVFLSAGRGAEINGDGTVQINDAWVDAKGSFLAAAGAGPVYRLLGKKDMRTAEFPSIETTLTDGDVAFRQHSGGHTAEPNWPTFLTFASRYLKTPGTTKSQ
jgi:(4-O-methyl)-D-glucuronate---lignin esterase